MSSATNEPYVVEECRGMLKLLSDGSVIRTPATFPGAYDDTKYPTITWQDITFDPVNDLQLRFYKPGSNPAPKTIILYFHGGGFCLGSREMPSNHNLCLKMAAELGAVVVSADYRLAPENRLPAAFQDGWTALKWVKTVYSEGQEVYIFGDSAGGVLAHNLVVRIASGGSSEIEPVLVKGCVLFEPGFFGVEKTKSELEGPSHTFLSLDDKERYVRLALPIGETADYPLVNPFGSGGPNFHLLDLSPLLIIVGGRDILRDRNKDYATRLSNLGKKIEYVELEGLEHAFLLTSSDPEPSNQVVSLVKKFILENSC